MLSKLPSAPQSRLEELRFAPPAKAGGKPPAAGNANGMAVSLCADGKKNGADKGGLPKASEFTAALVDRRSRRNAPSSAPMNGFCGSHHQPPIKRPPLKVG